MQQMSMRFYDMHTRNLNSVRVREDVGALRSW